MRSPPPGVSAERTVHLAASFAYLLVKSACLQTLPEGATAFQFMLLNLFPAEPTDRQMKPVITSDWFPVEGATEKGRDAAGAL